MLLYLNNIPIGFLIIIPGTY